MKMHSLIHRNTLCGRFWDGFYNFSNREYFVKSVKGKEIQVIENKNPRACSQMALKIALLFTLIVPLIAAIHYLISACRFRNYHVTLVRSEKMDQVIQVAQAKMIKPVEQQAIITLFPPPPPKKIVTEEQAVLKSDSLNAQEAYEYIKGNDVVLTSDSKKLLQKLETIPFSILGKWDLKNPNEVFLNVKVIELSLDEITLETIIWIESLKQLNTLKFSGTSFKDEKTAENLIVEYSNALLNVLKTSLGSLLSLLHFSWVDRYLTTKLFSLILTEENLSRLSADQLGLVFEKYGCHLQEELYLEKDNQKIIQALPQVDLYPFIFKANSDCYDLLNALIQLNSDAVFLKVLALSAKKPELLPSMLHKLIHTPLSKDEVMAKIIVKYFSSEMIFDQPDDLLKLISKEIVVIIILEKLFKKHESMKDIHYGKSFFSNINKLFIHKDVKPKTRLQFIYKLPIFSEFIIDYLKDEAHFQEFRDECLKKSSDQIFSSINWIGIQRKWRPYLLLIDRLYSLNDKPKLDQVPFVLEARPESFGLLKIKKEDWDAYDLISAFEFLYHVQNKLAPLTKALSSDEAMRLLYQLAPLDILEDIFLTLEKSYTIEEEIEQTTRFINAVLNNSEDKYISKIFEIYFKRIKEYSLVRFSKSLSTIIKGINSSKKLECILDCILKLPEKRRLAFQHAFSEGFIYLYDNTTFKHKLPINKKAIRKAFEKKGVIPVFSSRINLNKLLEAFKEN